VVLNSNQGCRQRKSPVVVAELPEGAYTGVRSAPRAACTMPMSAAGPDSCGPPKSVLYSGRKSVSSANSRTVLPEVTAGHASNPAKEHLCYHVTPD